MEYISDFHSKDPGSIPRVGKFFRKILRAYSILYMAKCWILWATGEFGPNSASIMPGIMSSVTKQNYRVSSIFKAIKDIWISWDSIKMHFPLSRQISIHDLVPLSVPSTFHSCNLLYISIIYLFNAWSHGQCRTNALMIRNKKRQWRVYNNVRCRC